MSDGMADVEQLLREFLAAFEADPGTDPGPYLARVEGAERRELVALIDAHLERSPRRRWDAAAFAASPARPLADDLARALEGVGGTWPVLLPRLRNGARLRRSELVARLAAQLGVPGREEKVGRYYHAMEHGMLEPAGVSERVLRALASVTGATVEGLRAAGHALPQPSASGPRSGATFARKATPDADLLAPMPAVDIPHGAAAAEGWDDIDELFRGG
jgi:hypothetical protein